MGVERLSDSVRELLPDRRAIKLTPISEIGVSTTANYLIKGLLPAMGIGVIYGRPKSAKTFMALDMVAHIASGSLYQGRRTKAGTVIYLALEGHSGIPARMEAMRRHLRLARDLPFFVVLVPVRLTSDGPHLVSEIRRQAPGAVSAVVVDTVRRSLEGSEANDEDLGGFLDAAQAISEALSCFTLLVHHMGHEGTRPRGHSSLGGAVDVQVRVDKDGDGVITTTVELAKDLPEGATWRSRLKTLELGLDDEGDPITSCVIVEDAGQESAPSRQGKSIKSKASRDRLARAFCERPTAKTEELATACGGSTGWCRREVGWN